MQQGALALCSFLAAASQFSILIGQKMQLTGWQNGKEMRIAICVETQTSISGPTVHSLYLLKSSGLVIGLTKQNISLTWSHSLQKPIFIVYCVLLLQPSLGEYRNLSI